MNLQALRIPEYKLYSESFLLYRKYRFDISGISTKSTSSTESAKLALFGVLLLYKKPKLIVNYSD